MCKIPGIEHSKDYILNSWSKHFRGRGGTVFLRMVTQMQVKLLCDYQFKNEEAVALECIMGL